MHKFKGIASIIHGVLKFHKISGIGTIPTKRKSDYIEHIPNHNSSDKGIQNSKGSIRSKIVMQNK